MESILKALREHSMYCSPKKMDLFCTELKFLGHIILTRGIKADPRKIDAIKKWPVPKSVTEVRAFLGLRYYISSILPKLAEHSVRLSPLMTKEAEWEFPKWGEEQQEAFNKIKNLVLSRQCLTVIDHKTPGDQQIFVTCNASDRGTGAVLSFGTEWKSARLVAFESMQLKSSEKNYPVHEKELLAIVRALSRWHFDLLGSHFKIFTDHRTLEYFLMQKDLSWQQAQWQEFLAQYDFEIVYLKGKENMVVDALSRVEHKDKDNIVAPVFTVKADTDLVEKIKEGYQKDDWCRKIQDNMQSTTEASIKDGLMYWKERLIIPRHGSIRESLFQLAHDTLGHYGVDKSYGAL